MEKTLVNLFCSHIIIHVFCSDAALPYLFNESDVAMTVSFFFLSVPESGLSFPISLSPTIAAFHVTSKRLNVFQQLARTKKSIGDVCK